MPSTGLDSETVGKVRLRGEKGWDLVTWVGIFTQVSSYLPPTCTLLGSLSNSWPLGAQ